jgi:hypothetical protein
MQRLSSKFPTPRNGAATAEAGQGRWRTPLLLLIATLILLWPAAVNRQPFLFADTTAYVRGADAAVFKATGIASPWTDELFRRLAVPVRPVVAQPAAAQPASESQSRAVLSGRSIYYGLFLYLLMMPLGSFWPVAIVQALLTSLCLFLTWKRFDGERVRPAWLFPSIVGALSVATPLAYFACYVMPDLFAALGVLASVLLLLAREQRRGETVFWFAILIAAALFHSADLLIIGGTLAVALALGLLRLIRLAGLGIASVCLALFVGLGGEAAFDRAVTHTTGAPPVRPPFVMARLIDDGPGTRYLREACARDPGVFFVCRYRDRLPLNSDDFLWSPSTRNGVFMTVSVAEQRALSREQGRFALAVVAHRPVEQVIVTLGNVARQLRLIGLSDFGYEPGMAAFLTGKLPPAYLDAQRGSLAFHSLMPIATVQLITVASVLVSFVLLGDAAVRARRRVWRPLSPVAGAMMLLVLGLLVNAAVCGGMSTPHHRYQARVIWLLPLAALLAWSGAARRRDPVPA